MMDDAGYYYVQLGMGQLACGGGTYASRYNVGNGRKTVESRKVRIRKRGFVSRH